MKAYIFRRLLYMIPTLLGISLAVFGIIQLVPGGPVEEAIANMQQAAAETGADPSRVITPQEIENIKKYYGFDEPVHIRYLKWLGNIIRFDFGHSFAYNEPVWDVMKTRFPISLFFGLTAFLISYSICIPLGIKKAMKNQTPFDTWTSVLIFAGYVLPGYALGIILIIFFAGGNYFELFPLGGIVSDDFESLSLFGKIGDFLHHMTLPLICYMISEFAFLTLLMKNSILEEISKDYMKLAQVKGANFRTAVWKHALRNSLIPIATRMSEIFTLIFTGALLIERVFDIDGMGLLVWNSIVSRDYNVVMGIIVFSSFLTLLGRLFADIMYVVVDPRIRFD